MIKFKSFLGDGSNYGIKISYEIFSKPEGIAQAFLIGEKFIGNSPVALILGDNIFYGKGISSLLRNANKKRSPQYSLIELVILNVME